MLEIQVAGAGAGKTYELAKKLLHKLKSSNTEKKFYALTFTNSAKEKIESELIKQKGCIPERVIVETVHSFLLNEIIYPFSYYITDIKYHSSSVIFLGSNDRFKAIKVKRLKDAGFVHVDKVYSVSKKIIDKNTSGKTVAIKSKVDNIILLLSSCIEAIYIDEIQDLDKDGLRVFEVLGRTNIDTYMIGDPKQAIKYPTDCIDFIDELKKDSTRLINLLEPNNVTRRVPEKILVHSNRFCYDGQSQNNLYKKKGSISYIESTSQHFESFIQKHIDSNESIVCIDKKNGVYSTNNSQEKYSFPQIIENKIKNSNTKRDPELLIRSSYLDFFSDNKNGKTFAINELTKKFNISLERSEYAELCDLCNKINIKDAKYSVSSIDSVKGLECNTCVFILSKNTLNYFLQNNIKEDKKFNKEWKKVYVALTRCKEELVLVLDHSLLTGLDIESIKSTIERMIILPLQA